MVTTCFVQKYLLSDGCAKSNNKEKYLFIDDTNTILYTYRLYRTLDKIK